MPDGPPTPSYRILAMYKDRRRGGNVCRNYAADRQAGGSTRRHGACNPLDTSKGAFYSLTSGILFPRSLRMAGAGWGATPTTPAAGPIQVDPYPKGSLMSRDVRLHLT
jgi:hypothetical protein